MMRNSGGKMISLQTEHKMDWVGVMAQKAEYMLHIQVNKAEFPALHGPPSTTGSTLPKESQESPCTP